MRNSQWSFYSLLNWSTSKFFYWTLIRSCSISLASHDWCSLQLFKITNWSNTHIWCWTQYTLHSYTPNLKHHTTIYYLSLEAIKKQISSQQIALEEGRDTVIQPTAFYQKKKKKKIQPTATGLTLDMQKQIVRTITWFGHTRLAIQRLLNKPTNQPTYFHTYLFGLIYIVNWWFYLTVSWCWQINS